MVEVNINITYELCPGIDLDVEAYVTPGQPERRPDLDHPGNPAEPPEVYSSEVTLDGGEIDTDGLFIGTGITFDQDERNPVMGYRNVLEDIESKVLDKFYEGE